MNDTKPEIIKQYTISQVFTPKRINTLKKINKELLDIILLLSVTTTH